MEWDSYSPKLPISAVYETLLKKLWGPLGDLGKSVPEPLCSFVVVCRCFALQLNHGLFFLMKGLSSFISSPGFCYDLLEGRFFYRLASSGKIPNLLITKQGAACWPTSHCWKVVFTLGWQKWSLSVPSLIDHNYQHSLVKWLIWVITFHTGSVGVL